MPFFPAYSYEDEGRFSRFAVLGMYEYCRNVADSGSLRPTWR